MLIKSLTIKGFECIGHDPGVKLSDLSQINVLIGPNNVGKSSIFRLLNLIHRALLNPGLDHDFRVSLSSITQRTDTFFFGCNTFKKVTFDIQLGEIDSTKFSNLEDLPFIRNGECRFNGELSWSEDSSEDAKPTLTFIPCFVKGDEWLAVRKTEESGKELFLTEDGKYESIDSSILNEWGLPAAFPKGHLDVAKSVMTAWAKQMKFFDAVRSISKGEKEQLMDDGSTLRESLYKDQASITNGTRYLKLKSQVLNHINGLLVPSGVARIEGFDIKGEPPNLIIELHTNGLSVPIASMGSGIAELFMACCWIGIEDGEKRQYFLEEPETHMHPGLLRRYIDYLTRQRNIQLFINTHSSVIMNALSLNSTLWLLKKDRNAATSAHKCAAFIEQHNALDSLGIRGSDLMQANCAIWVEGPSDRIHVNRWFRALEYAWSKDTIIEGSDYSFVFYGGKILSHHSISESESSYVEPISELSNEPDKVISMLRLSRFSAVLMDLDLPPGKAEEEVRDTKQRIKDEAKQDQKHRRYYFTIGREVENDIQPSLFNAALEVVLGLKSDSLKDLRLSGKERFTDEVAQFLEHSEEDAKALKAKLQQSKVKLAEAIKKPSLIRREQVPSYIEDLYKFVVSTRSDFDQENLDEEDCEFDSDFD